jgi:hypothetical protein
MTSPRPVPPARKPAAKPQPLDDDSLTQQEFCRLEKISVRTLDALRLSGGAPKFYRIGRQLRLTRSEHARLRAELMARER